MKAHTGFGTLAVHAGVTPDPATGAVMTPIYQTSTYAQQAPGQHKGYEYARTQNPTRTALEASVAALEQGAHGIAFASGMAAMDAVVRLLRPGDEVLAGNDLYGGSYRLLQRVYAPLGIKSRFVDLAGSPSLEALVSPRTKMIWIETPTNPLLRISDIAALCAQARQLGIRTVVDNTFASPYLQQPLELGADLVIHSATKYLGGHSDVVLGVVVTRLPEVAERLYFLQNAAGAVPGPHDCFLVLRGVKTLHLRMERACDNAEQIAQWLEVHPRVARVYYPGLPTHPQHELAARQMRRFGGMLSFDLEDASVAAAMKVLRHTQLFTLAESLGGVESLIGHPATMTHAAIPREERLRSGLSDGLIRLSVGVEDVADLIADLEQALK